MTTTGSTGLRKTIDGNGRRWRIGVKIAASVALLAGATNAVTFDNSQYAENLAIIQSQTVRNDNHDNSPFRDVAADDIVQADLLGPRSEYLGNPNGNPEQSFPIAGGGQFRTSCEFSHFAYDDPIVFPGQPGAAHLHMFFGNTDINAFTDDSTLVDSGGSTCNGGELNRTGYWVPALFDGDGNVRIPERAVVYYKGENWANAGRNPVWPDGTPNEGAQVYEPGMRNIAPNPTINQLGNPGGGFGFDFKCTNNFSADFPAATVSGSHTVAEIPNCDGDFYQDTFGAPYPATRTVLEMEVRFWNCHPDPSTNPDYNDYENWVPTITGDWFRGDCNGNFGFGTPPSEAHAAFPDLRYFVNYVVEPGETTEDWFFSSDVDPSTLNQANPSLVAGGAGSTHHADWMGAWNEETNQDWIDNCVNFDAPNGDVSGCGFGYLTDGGTDSSDPLPGPALQYRPQFDTVGDSSSYKVSAQQLFNELCVPLGTASHTYITDRHAAYCDPS